jgi:hypothetical protein
MFRTYLRFIFRGLLVEITSAIHLVLNLHKLLQCRQICMGFDLCISYFLFTTGLLVAYSDPVENKK